MYESGHYFVASINVHDASGSIKEAFVLPRVYGQGLQHMENKLI